LGRESGVGAGMVAELSGISCMLMLLQSGNKLHIHNAPSAFVAEFKLIAEILFCQLFQSCYCNTFNDPMSHQLAIQNSGTPYTVLQSIPDSRPSPNLSVTVSLVQNELMKMPLTIPRKNFRKSN
jgi:hypothetical protein